MKKRIIKSLLVVVVTLLGMSQMVMAKPEKQLRGGHQATRTVLLYLCGSNLESMAGLGTFNLEQVLRANFSAGEETKFIVMTGGADLWSMSSARLDIDPSLVPDGEPTNKVSNRYNQIWEARGADAPSNAGKMVLLDGDGITKDTPVLSKDELMSEPDTLKAFINYGVKNYPADKFDLILWDHGGGPTGGFGYDDHIYEIDDSIELDDTMPFSEIAEALADNELTNPSEGEARKFDFVDFDACLMSSVELNLVLADYTDYYIASPELEPGYGQEYSGWLNALGENPDIDTFELGKKIVDDFYDFYDSGYGSKDSGTLAIVDTKKLLNSGFVDALLDLNDILNEEVDNKAFYDEFGSVDNAIRYGEEDFYDLGNLASLITVTNSEISDEDLDEASLDASNAYDEARITQRFEDILSDQSIIYARGTDDIVAKDKPIRTYDGGMDWKDLTTSGMYIFFNPSSETTDSGSYYRAMNPVVEAMPNKVDGRYEFLNRYKNTAIKYDLVGVIGRAVNEMLNEDGLDKSEINFEALKHHYLDEEFPQYSFWNETVRPLLEMCFDDEEEAKQWIEELMAHHVDEVVAKENIEVQKVKEDGGSSYYVDITDTRKRVIKTVKRNVKLEIPALEDYIETLDEYDQTYINMALDVSLGSIEGEMDFEQVLSGDCSIKDLMRWYNEKDSSYILPTIEEKWYALEDANGQLHAASVYGNYDEKFLIATVDVNTEYREPVILEFAKDEEGNIGELQRILFAGDGVTRPINPKDLTEELELMPVVYVNYRGHFEYYLPISDNTFVLSPETMDDISLKYTKLSKINDIRDTDGDGEVLDNYFTVTDIYGDEINITDDVNNPKEEKISAELIKAKDLVYSGQELKPILEYNGQILEENVDYVYRSYNDSDWDTPIVEEGEYLLLIFGRGKFKGMSSQLIKVVKSEETTTAQPATTIAPAETTSAATKKISIKQAKIKKVTAKKKKLIIKMKKSAKALGGDKFKVRYKVKGASKWKIKISKKKTITLKKLKRRKKYIVQVRAFKKVGKKTYVGAWSKAKVKKVR